MVKAFLSRYQDVPDFSIGGVKYYHEAMLILLHRENMLT